MVFKPTAANTCGLRELQFEPEVRTLTRTPAPVGAIVWTKCQTCHQMLGSGRPKQTLKKQVEKETEKVGLKKEDAQNRTIWRDGIRRIAKGMG